MLTSILDYLRAPQLGLICQLLALFTLWPEPSAGAITPQERDTLQAIAKQGRIVPESELPAIYKYLGQMITRLGQAQAQIQMGEHRYVSANRLYIVESAVPNAYVWTNQEGGVHAQNNNIVVTTGLLALMQAGAQDVAHREPGTRVTQILPTLLADILAHEFAHPLTRQDSELKRNNTSQAEEILADHFGMKIAKQAGYSTQGLLTSIQWLDSHVAQQTTDGLWASVQAGFASHPESVVRATHLRLVLMLDKVSGQQSSWTTDPVSPAFMRELEALVAKPAQPRPHSLEAPPEMDIDTILNTFEKPEAFAFPNDRLEAKANAAANLWLLRLDQALKKVDLPANEVLLDRVLRVLLSFAEKNIVNRWGKESFSEPTYFIYSEMLKAGYKELRFHNDYLIEVPFFRSGAWKDKVKQKFPTYKEGRDVLFSLLHPQDLFELYESEVENSLVGFVEITGQLRKGTFRQGLEWSYVLHQKLVHKIKPARLKDFLTIHSDHAQQIASRDELFAQPLYFDPITFQIMSPSHLTARQTDEVVAKDLEVIWSKHPDVHLKMQKIAKVIWENRARYILADFAAAAGRHFAWDIVLKLNGIGQSDGYRDLNALLQNTLTIYTEETTDRKEDPRSTHALPWLAADTVLKNQDHPSKIVRQRLFNGSPQAFRQVFASRLKKRLQGQPLDPNAIEVAIKDVQEEMMGRPGQYREETSISRSSLTAPIEDIVALVIARANLPLEARREALEDRYLGEKFVSALNTRGDFSDHWSTHKAFGANEKILDTLIRSGVVRSAHHYFQISAADAVTSYKAQDQSWLFANLQKAISGLDHHVYAHIEGLSRLPQGQGRIHALLDAAITYLAPAPNMNQNAEYSKRYSDDTFREIRRRIVKVANQTSMSLEQRVRLFEALTATGLITETDQYFRQHILAEIGRLDPQSFRLLQRTLGQHRLMDQSLSVAVAERLMNPVAVNLRTHPHDRDVMEFLAKLDQLLPFKSPLKDELIERLSWKSRIQEDRLLNLVNEHKAINWRRFNPQLVNWSSFIAENLKDLSREQMKDLMLYLSDPQHLPFPTSLDRSLQQAAEKIVAGIVKEMRSENTPVPERLEELRKQTYLRLQEKFTAMARNSSSTDRVPIFALLLHLGREPYALDRNYPDNVISELLNLQRGSVEEVALRSWIETIPAIDREFEVTSTIAYQLSMMGSEKASVRSGFELFGVIGKKMGQAASILEVFSALINAELAELKDSRRGLDKMTIKQKISQRLGHSRFELLDLLGAASIKTVALIRLESGELRAVHLLNENARETLQTNINRAKIFVQRMADNGVTAELELFNAYIHALEQSLPSELDLRIEVEKYRRMKAFFDGANSRLSGSPWRFAVPVVDPTVVQQDFYMTSYAPGVGFDELPEGKEKATAGELIFKTLAQGLLSSGQFEPDRHHKNIKVDLNAAGGGVIHMLDPGQFEEFQTSILPFKVDDRLILARFLYGVSQRDVEVATDAVIRMGTSTMGKNQLKALVHNALGQSINVFQRITQLIKTLHREHFLMDYRFSFSALKGLMVLVKENYVPVERAEEILKDLVTQVFLRKMDLGTLNSARPSLSQCARILTGQ